MNASMVDGQAIPTRNPRVAARVVGKAALVVVLDRREVHRLNRVGARIWELCDGRTLAEIRDCIVSEFAAPEDEVWRDLGLFVGTLQQVGALTLQDPRDGTAGQRGEGVE